MRSTEVAMSVKHAWSVTVALVALGFGAAPVAGAHPQPTGSANASCSNSGTQDASYTIAASPLPLPQAVSRIVTDGAVQYRRALSQPIRKPGVVLERAT